MTAEAEQLVTAAYSIPQDIKDRLEQDAAKQDLKTSQLVRRILRDYFERLDALDAAKPNKTRKPESIAA